MHTSRSAAFALVALAGSTGCATQAASPAADLVVRAPSAEEAAAVHGVLASLDAAWNRHDIDRLAALLTDDVHWIVGNGNCWRSRQQVWEAYFTLHQHLAADSPLSTVRTERTEVRMFGAEVAHGIATLMFGDGSNGSDQDGSGWHARASFVMVLVQGSWQIAQFHQTLLDPRVEREDPVWGDAARSQPNAEPVGR